MVAPSRFTSAKPLVAWAILTWNWRAAFVLAGVLGLVWVVLWMRFYQHPSRHPALSDAESNERLLPVMQANRPARPRVTWTYDAPAERPRPDYRMVLVYNAANDLTAQRVCDSQFRHKTGTPGRVSVFAVYCRNDQPMSQTTAWTEASGPDDPRLGAMFSALFQVLFVEVNPNRPMPTFLSPM